MLIKIVFVILIFLRNFFEKIFAIFTLSRNFNFLTNNNLNKFLREFQIFRRISYFWANFKFSGESKIFVQNLKSLANFKILGGFHIFGRISNFWANFKFVGKFQNFGRISNLWANCKILGEFQIFGPISNLWANLKFLVKFLGEFRIFNLKFCSKIDFSVKIEIIGRKLKCLILTGRKLRQPES